MVIYQSAWRWGILELIRSVPLLVAQAYFLVLFETDNEQRGAKMYTLNDYHKYSERVYEEL
jgi:hypothetical protein